MNYIEKLPFTKGWYFEKLKQFNSELGQVSLISNEVLFDIGSPAEVFYIVKSGQLVVEAIIEIEEYNKYPTGLQQWEVKTTKREILFQVHILNQDDIFGLQETFEMMKAHKETKGNSDLSLDTQTHALRKYRVKTLCDTTLIYLNNYKIPDCKLHLPCLTIIIMLVFCFDDLQRI